MKDINNDKNKKEGASTPSQIKNTNKKINKIMEINDNSNQQYIYSSFLTGYITINRDVISKLGLNDYPFLRTVYILLTERADWNTGSTMFSARFAEETLNISFKKYKRVLADLENLGLIKIYKGRNSTTYVKLIHYKDVTNGVKKDVNYTAPVNTTLQPIITEEVKEEPITEEVKEEPIIIHKIEQPVKKTEDTSTKIEKVDPDTISLKNVDNIDWDKMMSEAEAKPNPVSQTQTQPSFGFNLIKDHTKYELEEGESEELLDEYFNVVGGGNNKASVLNYIRSSILYTKETFDEYCNRIISLYKEDFDDKLINDINKK